MRFQGRVVMVTGAAGALGRMVAATFEREGASLVLLDASAEGLRAAFGEAGGTRLPVAADLTDDAAVRRAVDAALARFGRIDVLCNIAGAFRMGPPVHETPAELWRFMMDVNAGTVLSTARAVVPAMLAAGSGRIVNVSAAASREGKAGMAAYCASKDAVTRLTESMAAELRDRGINVNCVLPSIIDTPQNRKDMPDADFARWVAPAALAEVIAFLASDAARAVHGAAIPVVGLS